MTVWHLLVLITVSAVLIAIASLGRRTALLLLPILFSVVCVAGAVGLGRKSKILLVCVGAIAGVAGILTANTVFPTYLDRNVDVHFTNMEYNVIYRSNLADIAILVPVAFLVGAAIGFFVNTAYMNRSRGENSTS